MIIVHIITAFGIGGAEKLLLNIINEQVKTHEVHLIYLKPINDLIHLLDKRVKNLLPTICQKYNTLLSASPINLEP